MKRLLGTASLNTDLAALLLRIILGGMMIMPGLQKMENYSEMVTQFDPIGLGNDLSLILVIFAEFFCGIFLVLGFLTRFSVIPILITMIVAFFVAHASQPFEEKMVPFIFMCLCVVVFIVGSGKYSVDKALFNRGPASVN